MENILEELDEPGEWMYDPVASKLHFWPNGTSAPAEVVAPLLTAIFHVEGATGGQATPARLLYVLL